MKNVLLAVFMAFLAMPLRAQTPVATPVVKTNAVTLALQPIDTRFTTLDGLTYSQNGYELKDLGDFKIAIDPLHDYESSRLIDRSIQTDDLARWFKVVGFLIVAGGVVEGISTSNGSGSDAFLLAVVGGELTFDVGLLFGSESQTTKFNAVQRYNRFAYGREQLLPQTPVDGKSLLPAVVSVTAVTPGVTIVPTVAVK